jgi:hypothetical protein
MPKRVSARRAIDHASAVLFSPLVEGKAAMVDVVPVCDLNATVANFHSR